MIFERVSQDPFTVRECITQLRESPSMSQGVAAGLAVLTDPDTAIPLLLAAFPLFRPAQFSPQFVVLYRDIVHDSDALYVGQCRRGVPRVPRSLGGGNNSNMVAALPWDSSLVCGDLRRVFSAGDVSDLQAQRAAAAAAVALAGSRSEEAARAVLDAIVFGLSSGSRSTELVKESLLAGLVGWRLADPASEPWTLFPGLLQPFVRAVVCATRGSSSLTLRSLVKEIVANAKKNIHRMNE